MKIEIRKEFIFKDTVQEIPLLVNCRVGTRVLINDDEYILANVDTYKVSLINLVTGLRITDGVSVDDLTLLTEAEWEAVCAGYDYEVI